MKSLLIEPTSTALWYSLVNQAEQACAIQLHQDLENYLILLLQRFTNEVAFSNKIMGLEFLNTLHQTGVQQQDALRDVGDQCLLISGLFPGRAEKRNVRISYFISIGQNAYAELAQHTSQGRAPLFTHLYQQFVRVMDVLQATRELSDKTASLSPLQAEEIWNDTKSQHALAVLQNYTSKLPLFFEHNKQSRRH